MPPVGTLEWLRAWWCLSCLRKYGAQGRNRTTDTVIFSHVLYQLSYLGGSGEDGSQRL